MLRTRSESSQVALVLAGLATVAATVTTIRMFLAWESTRRARQTRKVRDKVRLVLTLVQYLYLTLNLASSRPRCLAHA